MFIPIFSVDGACGSRKTRKMVDHVGRAVRLGASFIIFQPTRLLIAETAKQFAERFPDVPVHVFTSDTFPGEVYRRLQAHMAACHEPNVILTTHRALLDMPGWQNQAKYHAIVDEIPQVDFSFQCKLPLSHGWLMPHFEITECNDNLYYELSIKPASVPMIKRWAKFAHEDSALAFAKELLWQLVSPHRKLYVRRTSVNFLGELHRTFDVHGYLEPTLLEGWQSATVMGANFANSMLAQIWSLCGVAFTDHPHIRPDYRVHDRKTAARVEITYFSERSWSKRLMAQLGDDTFAQIRPLIPQVFGDEPYLWVANNSIRDEQLPDPNGRRISNVSHGSNAYRDYHRLAFLSALNATPQHLAWLAHKFGITPAEQKRAQAHEMAYQCLMRTSLRCPVATAPVRVLVPDIELANFLAGEVFPGARLSAITSEGLQSTVLGDAAKKRGRPRKDAALSQVERNRRHLVKKEALNVTKNTIQKAFFVTSPDLSFETSTWSRPDAVVREDFTGWDEIYDLLRQAHGLSYRTKEDNFLVATARFDPGQAQGTGKGRDNIVYVRGLQLDFEGGALTPQDWRRILPEHAWLACNSYRNGQDGELRWRVFLPFAAPASAEVAEAIWDLLAARIEDAGFFVGSKAAWESLSAEERQRRRFSGLDTSKRPANSFFYLPCQAKLAGQSFWLEHLAGVPLLDPWAWVERVERDEPETITLAPVRNAGEALARLRAKIKEREDGEDDPILGSSPTQQRVEAAVQRWRTAARGEGNAAFYLLARTLQTAGLDRGEIRLRLQDEVPYARSPKDRRAQIPHLIKRL